MEPEIQINPSWLSLWGHILKKEAEDLQGAIAQEPDSNHTELAYTLQTKVHMMFPLAARVKEMLTTFSKDELDPESDGFYLYCESTRFANDYADAVLIVSAFIKANRQMKMESLLELYEEAAIERIEDEDTKPSSPMDAFCKAVKPGKEQS